MSSTHRFACRQLPCDGLPRHHLRSRTWLGYLRQIARWRAQGYRVSLVFLALPNAETAIARVASRVRQGGHGIPEPVIRRRFAAGWDHFHLRYKQAVDDWVLYNNAGAAPLVLEWGENQ